MIEITVIGDRFDTAPQAHAFASWADFADWFTTIHATDQPKTALSGWIPATFNGQRKDENVIKLSVLVFDLDHDVDPGRIERALAGRSYAISPTYSHTENEPRYRVAVELARPVTPEEFSVLWEQYGPAIGADPACKNPSRFYYEPAAPVASAGVIIPGKPLDPALPPPAAAPGAFTELERNREDPGRDTRLSRWAEKGEKRLETACKRIRKAPEGARNNTLNREAFSIGRLTPHILELSTARARLLEAASNADYVLPSAEAERTIDRSLAEGAERPILVDQDWHSRLVWDQLNGGVRQCGGNVLAALADHPDLAGCLAFDSRRDLVLLETEPPWSNDPTPRAWTDADSVHAMAWAGKLEPAIITSTSVIHEVAAAVARQAATDPFLDWLEGLTWDGESRLTEIPAEFMGATAPIEGVFFARWMIAAVARTIEPGCKVDTMLVLVGEQGSGKSTFLRELVPDPDYYTGKIPRGDKDQLMALQGPVIVDDGELRNYGVREVEELKAFITEQVDRYRSPYAREIANHSRRCVLAATTNRAAFLRDDTGGRRFWPIEVSHRIPFDLVHLIRADLWAEAVALYRAGEQWWLTEDEEIEAERTQEAHRERDPLEEVMAKRLAETHVAGENVGIIPEQLTGGRIEWLGTNLACRLVNVSIQDQNGIRRVNRALSALGWRYREGVWK